MSPNGNARFRQSCEGYTLFVGRLHCLLYHDTFVRDASQGDADVRGTFYYLPCAAVCAGNGTIFFQLDFYRSTQCLVGMVQSVTVYQHLVRTGNILRCNLLCRVNVGTLHLFACIFKWGDHQPFVFVLENLMYPHLVRLSPVLKACVVNKICASVFSRDDGVVTLGTF